MKTQLLTLEQCLELQKMDRCTAIWSLIEKPNRKELQGKFYQRGHRLLKKSFHKYNLTLPKRSRKDGNVEYAKKHFFDPKYVWLKAFRDSILPELGGTLGVRE